MQIIGITGGVASGKSMVAEQFARLGAVVLDADKIGHEVLRLPAVESAARERWGNEIFGEDRRIDRAKLARIVFASNPKASAERAYLEQLTHPEIQCRIEKRLDSMSAAGKSAAVLDAALLVEANWDELCEKIVYIDAPRNVRLARAVARGWTKEDFEAREGVQESLNAKLKRADVIIDNSGPPQRTQAQIEHFWASLIR